MENEKSYAYECIEMVKASNRRIFVIAIMELMIIVGMVVGYFVYESQFEYEYGTEEAIQTIENTSLEGSTISQY